MTSDALLRARDAMIALAVLFALLTASRGAVPGVVVYVAQLTAAVACSALVLRLMHVV